MPPCLRADRSAATLRFARNEGGAWNGAPAAAKAADSSQRKWKIKNGKMKLRSPHDTEPDAVADVVGRDVDALRRAAGVGVAEPVAAAQQTGRPSRGPCGVGHAC